MEAKKDELIRSVKEYSGLIAIESDILNDCHSSELERKLAERRLMAHWYTLMQVMKFYERRQEKGVTKC